MGVRSEEKQPSTLLPNGTYGTYRTYGSVPISPISHISHIGPIHPQRTAHAATRGANMLSATSFGAERWHTLGPARQLIGDS